MKKYYLAFVLLLLSIGVRAQYAFELQVTYATRIQNSEQYSVSGTLKSGRIETGKIYYTEEGAKLEVKNLMSSKTATSVPVSVAPESVSVGLLCKDYMPESNTVLRCISTRGTYGGNSVRYNPNQLPEGVLSCKINGRMYKAQTISKPVYIRQSNTLDLFFQAEDESVVWLQIMGFSDIEAAPHQQKSDTSQANKSLVCKLAYLPQGYRPTDMPNNYQAYEDVKGNAGVMIVSYNKYKKQMSLEFSGILRANARVMEEKPNAGLFYISEGKVDNISWDAF